MPAEPAPPIKPRVKRSFAVIGHSPNVVEFRHGTWNTVAHTVSDDSRSGRLLTLISALDGTSTPAELAALHRIEHDEIDALIAHLRGLGVLEDTPSTALDHYLDTHAAPLRAPQPPPARPVRVLGDADLAELVTGLVRQALPGADVAPDTAGIALKALNPQPGWARDELWLSETAAQFDDYQDAIVVWAQYRPDPLRIEVFNRIALRRGIRWVHGTIDGPFMIIGPAVLPGATACYQCLETRVLMNLKNSASYQDYKTALARAAVSGGDPPVLAPLRHMLAAYLALETVNLHSTAAAYTTGKTLTIYLPTWEHAVQDLLAVPDCTACGGAEEEELYFDAGAWLDARD
ncbi:TOMM precursor leader peptide-binding protein [Spirillospora sp. CA-255316]